jgi:glycerol-3-phosphate cytidylyltransferase-like family protein
VDTRSKIVNARAAPPGGVLAVGYFEVPGVEHVRSLRDIRGRARPLVAVVLPAPHGRRELLSQQARAEMAAALRMVDYVLIAARPGLPGDFEDLVRRLRPATVVPLDEAESGRMRRLIEHIQHGQIV